MRKKSIEGRVADTILQEKMKVKVGKKTFIVERPTLGTLVMVSEQVASLPEFHEGNKVESVLANCVHGKEVARILAIFILGAKRVKNPFKWVPAFLRRSVRSLEGEILLNLTNSQICSALSEIIQESELDDFFAVSTFLSEVNLTSARKVEKKKTTTASGPSSQE